MGKLAVRGIYIALLLVLVYNLASWNSTVPHPVPWEEILRGKENNFQLLKDKVLWGGRRPLAKEVKLEFQGLDEYWNEVSAAGAPLNGNQRKLLTDKINAEVSKVVGLNMQDTIDILASLHRLGKVINEEELRAKNRIFNCTFLLLLLTLGHFPLLAARRHFVVLNGLRKRAKQRAKEKLIQLDQLRHTVATQRAAIPQQIKAQVDDRLKEIDLESLDSVRRATQAKQQAEAKLAELRIEEARIQGEKARSEQQAEKLRQLEVDLRSLENSLPGREEQLVAQADQLACERVEVEEKLRTLEQYLAVTAEGLLQLTLQNPELLRMIAERAAQLQAASA